MTSPVFLFVVWTFAEPFSVKSFALPVTGQNSEIASFDAIFLVLSLWAFEPLLVERG